MVGAKNRLAGELSGVTCPEKKDFKCFSNEVICKKRKKKQ